MSNIGHTTQALCCFQARAAKYAGCRYWEKGVVRNCRIKASADSARPDAKPSVATREVSVNFKLLFVSS